MKTIIANRYSLLHKLGEGGMADVYLAIDTILNREVAVKILRGDLATDPVAVLRFKREATAALTLNHPNIVQVYDVGEEEGQHYIVMEYIKGITLKQLISKRGALDKQEAVDIMKQLVGAMVHAHKNNVVHRDIKPQNVLIKDDGTVKLTDFGIALAQNVAQLTQADAVLGSVHYLAPEIARGEAASEQSDIYALGIVFYELLSGNVPYQGEAPVQVAMKHLREEIPSIREFNPTIPQSVENIIIIATAKNRINRYKNTSAMASDIETCLDPMRAHEAKVVFENLVKNDQPTLVLKTNDKPDPKVKQKEQLSMDRLLAVSLIAFAIVSLAALLFLTGFGPFNSNVESVTIPDVHKNTIELAKMQLENEGLVPASTYKYDWSYDVEKGKVIGVVEGIGNKIDSGSEVTLIISEGLLYKVENYVGRDADEVLALLEEKGVKVRIQRRYTSEYPANTVIEQAGLVEGDEIKTSVYNEIRLTISMLSEMEVPNVEGLSVEDAEAELLSYGFLVEKIRLDANELSEGELAIIGIGVVTQQYPKEGEPVSIMGDGIVELYYY
ncbi:MAG: Stk1 family PASTA domain-containing Ser/Thr kinase [Erysipelotrichales bacterium]|nr:Stk1 family PASTA domain-containing Ser/Thr kinase [Erysipelotrichales bacterium]